MGGCMGGCMDGWVVGAEVRGGGGVRVKGRERWADRGHDGHDEVKMRRVVVRGCEAVVVVGGRRVASTRPLAHGVW